MTNWRSISTALSCQLSTCLRSVFSWAFSRTAHWRAAWTWTMTTWRRRRRTRGAWRAAAVPRCAASTPLPNWRRTMMTWRRRRRTRGAWRVAAVPRCATSTRLSNCLRTMTIWGLQCLDVQRRRDSQIVVGRWRLDVGGYGHGRRGGRLQCLDMQRRQRSQIVVGQWRLDVWF